jgi:regulatory protein
MPEDELFKTSLSRAMALCSGREYCSADIINKLQEWGLSADNTARVIDILTREKFIDDNRYASTFVRDKFNSARWGKTKISAHLKAKGIPGDIITSALDSIDNDHYRKTLEELLSAHRRFIKAKNQYDLKGKLWRFGISRGFESDLLYQIINESW